MKLFTIRIISVILAVVFTLSFNMRARAATEIVYATQTKAGYWELTQSSKGWYNIERKNVLTSNLTQQITTYNIEPTEYQISNAYLEFRGTLIVEANNNSTLKVRLGTTVLQTHTVAQINLSWSGLSYQVQIEQGRTYNLNFNITTLGNATGYNFGANTGTRLYYTTTIPEPPTQPPPPTTNPNAGDIVVIPLEHVKGQDITWYHIVNRIYEQLIADKQYQYKDYQYYTCTSYIDENTLNQMFFVTLSQQPLVNHVYYDNVDQAWNVSTLNNNVATQTWVLENNPEWDVDTLYIVNTNSTLNWGASHLYEYYINGREYTNYEGNKVKLKPALFLRSNTATEPQTNYWNFLNCNYLILEKGIYDYNPLLINDTNNVAAKYYDLWKLANGIDEGSITDVNIVGIPSKETNEGKEMQAAFDEANKALKEVDTEIPDVGQAMEVVSEGYEALTPLITLLILPAIGLAILPWLVKKHD